MPDSATPFPADLVAALGIGIALASAPGPVQAVILSEAARGGPRRALMVTAGAALTFGTLLVALALGLSALALGGTALRVLGLLGGLLLLWLAFDGLRASGLPPAASAQRGGVPPVVRGSLAVLLNPGAWLFLAAVAAPLIGTAGRQAGTLPAVLVALALEAGTASGDIAVALVAGLGLRRAGARPIAWVQRALAIVLAALGAWLLWSALVG